MEDGIYTYVGENEVVSIDLLDISHMNCLKDGGYIAIYTKNGSCAMITESGKHKAKQIYSHILKKWKEAKKWNKENA